MTAIVTSRSVTTVGDVVVGGGTVGVLVGAGELEGEFMIGDGAVGVVGESVGERVAYVGGTDGADEVGTVVVGVQSQMHS